MNLRDPSSAALDGLIDGLQGRLDARATAATREWWTKYLRGAAFRGVKMGDIRKLCMPSSKKSDWGITSPLGSRRTWP